MGDISYESVLLRVEKWVGGVLVEKLERYTSAAKNTTSMSMAVGASLAEEDPFLCQLVVQHS